MLLNADLHIHSPYSMATSRSMTPESLLAAAKMKGLDVLGSGDALHPAWRAAWRDRPEDGSGIVVVPTAEVEDRHRVHHLILAESFDQFAELAEVFAPHSKNVATAGRPHVALDGAAIASAVHDLGGLIGPAHAFTPWTSLYARFESPAGCYGSERIDFLELGLSADTSYAAGIPDLAGIPFISSSDAHSATPAGSAGSSPGSMLGCRGCGALDGCRREDRHERRVLPEEGSTTAPPAYTAFATTPQRGRGARVAVPGGREADQEGVADRAAELLPRPAGVPPPHPHHPASARSSSGSPAPHPATRRCGALRRTSRDVRDEITIHRRSHRGYRRSTRVWVTVEALRIGRITFILVEGVDTGSSFEEPAAGAAHGSI